MSGNMRRRRLEGFTLIELLVVIAIIGVLAALLLPVIIKAKCAAKASADKATIKNLDAALTAFNADYGVYPDDEGAAVLKLKIRPPNGNTTYFNLASGAPTPLGFPAKFKMPHLCPPPSVALLPKARQYYDVKEDDLEMGGTGFLTTKVGDGGANYLYYQEWASKAGPLKAAAKKPYSYDMWAFDCVQTPPGGTTPAAAAAMAIKNFPNETGTNNWGQ